MKLEAVGINEILPALRNGRRHNEKSVSSIRRSLSRFGQVENIVVQRSTMRLIAGHGRIMAMKELGHEFVEANIVDCTDEEAEALGVALNRSAELSEWDEPVLLEILSDLKNKEWPIEDLGWKIEDVPDNVELETIPADTFDDSKDIPKADCKVAMTKEQFEVVVRAIVQIKLECGPDMTDGRALELICADYLAGA